jgi:alpha-ketoglutaric semialdehyde dehydrogenase
MLTPGIFSAYETAVGSLVEHAHAHSRGRAVVPGEGPNQCQAQLFVTQAQDFLAEQPPARLKCSAPPR